MWGQGFQGITGISRITLFQLEKAGIECSRKIRSNSTRLPYSLTKKINDVEHNNLLSKCEDHFLDFDIGEGLNTVKNELHQVGLVPPVIEETENSVIVTIKHTRIASLEQVIRDLFRSDPNRTITNKIVRLKSGEQNINIVKKSLQNLRKAGYIKLKQKNVSTFKYEYVLSNIGKDKWIDKKS